MLLFPNKQLFVNKRKKQDTHLPYGYPVSFIDLFCFIVFSVRPPVDDIPHTDPG